MRVLVRPIGLDMVEVGGSNPPGPYKKLSICLNATFLKIASLKMFLRLDTTAERQRSFCCLATFAR